MSTPLAVSLTACAGGLVAMQAPINGRLGERLGTFPAATVSFAIGLAVLLALTVVVGEGIGSIGDVRGAAWWTLLGGVLGAVYVTSVLVTVRTLGAGGVTAATIAGQLTLSLVVDHFGWLGVERQPITLAKVAGVVLLAAGVFLVVRD